MKYTDLRTKTIFDITDVESILSQIVNMRDKCFFINNVNNTGRASTFLELAEITSDKELEKAVLEQFKDELNEDE